MKNRRYLNRDRGGGWLLLAVAFALMTIVPMAVISQCGFYGISLTVCAAVGWILGIGVIAVAVKKEWKKR